MFAVYFSMIRLKAIWAVDVMESASSRMMSLYVWRGDDFEEVEDVVKELKICFVEEKVLICSLLRIISPSALLSYEVEGRAKGYVVTARRQFLDRH